MVEPFVFLLRFPRLVETRFRFPPPEPPPGLVIAGPSGESGPAGPAGPRGIDGDGATDPGDLTLIFNNGLI